MIAQYEIVFFVARYNSKFKKNSNTRYYLYFAMENKMKKLLVLILCVIVTFQGCASPAEPTVDGEPVGNAIKAIACGDFHSLAVMADGSLWTWGSNEYGQLGDGTSISRSEPVKILEDVASVAAGSNHSFAIMKDGSLLAWGGNWEGQLGDGTNNGRNCPIKALFDGTYQDSNLDIPESDEPEITHDESIAYSKLYFPDGLYFPDEYNDHIAQTFLSALLNNEYRNIAYIVDATSAYAYKFIEDIEFSSGEIINSKILYRSSGEEKYESGKTFEIKLLVGKSNSPMFSAGESVWELDVTFGDDYYGVILRFECITVPQTDGINIPLPVSGIEEASIINFCHRMTTYVWYFGDTDDMNDIVPKWEDDEAHYEGFYHGILDLGLTQDDGAEEFKRAAEQYLEITDLDFSNFSLYSKEENTVICPGHGGIWVNANLKEMSFDEEGKQYSVIIDFYTDSCRFIVAKTVQYKLNQNNDGTFTMQSIKCIYDSGLPVRGGHV